MTSIENPKAVVLISGGLDSTTVLAMAIDNGYKCYTLSFDYGQRHRSELVAAELLSKSLGAIQHKVVQLDLGAIGGSALTDMTIDVPEPREATENGVIPITYVPARNTIFLSIAVGWAEVLEAREIFIGVNAVDYSGYPDCRPEYIQAYQAMANMATRAGIEGCKLTIQTPLINMTKAQIIARGIALGVDYRATVSCYQASPEGRACGLCDSCKLRKMGFKNAGVMDATEYQK
jgi:7-cyano-7-deazaguanine synthase